METKYYKEQLSNGNEYQDFIAIELQQRGIVLQNTSSKKYQNEVGENLLGMEIKLDNKTKDTNHLYIETAEKSNENNLDYVKSGIFRKDNTWLYGIGDYNKFYIFSIKVLKNIYTREIFLRKIETPTSLGFLIHTTQAKKWCAKLILFT